MHLSLASADARCRAIHENYFNEEILVELKLPLPPDFGTGRFVRF
jgi:hypothetical protein